MTDDLELREQIDELEEQLSEAQSQNALYIATNENLRGVIATLHAENTKLKHEVAALNRHVDTIRKNEDESVCFEMKMSKRAEIAACRGCLAAALGQPLHEVANSGYASRSREGDAWERGWQYVAESAAMQLLSSRLAAAEAERERYRELLDKAYNYIEHSGVCRQSPESKPWKCDCGHDEVSEAIQAALSPAPEQGT